MTFLPVNIITGFLGSGKTTLLGCLLRQPEFSRTAVIINEFGDIGLDHDLIEASEDSFIELQTGCLCCKIRNDLATTLDDMLRRRDQGRIAPFTRVVIETSGLADPAPILQTLMTDGRIASRVVLGGVVTTVDCMNGADTLAREAISVKQVAVADRLVLTKTDLAGRCSPHSCAAWRRSMRRRRYCALARAKSSRNTCLTAASTILSQSLSMSDRGWDQHPLPMNMRMADMTSTPIRSSAESRSGRWR
jgi:G3E family GTPase